VLDNMAASLEVSAMLNSYRLSRPLRGYAWLAVLPLAAGAVCAHAGSVYRCADAHGAVAFQDRPCENAADQSLVELAPAPKYTPPPKPASERESPARAASHSPRANPAPRREASTGAASYECRTADGQVFYRHGACPRSVPAVGAASGGRATAGNSVAVTSTRVPREQACYELRRAGAAGRGGHRHDQDVSTYDKNLGRDPCG
jgi:hypothetical protein